MRKEIRQKLIDDIPDIQGRVFEPHAAGAKTPKPYLVILQGNESEINSWNGGQTNIEIWPYQSRTTFQNVDELTKKIVAALDKKLITTAAGDAFTCIYTGSSGEDVVDEEWDAITRPLKFIVLTISNQLTTDPDPIAGMNQWILQAFPELQIDPLTWTLTDTTPAIYWRFASMRVIEQWSVVSWIEATIMGHILAPTPKGRLLWTKKITDRLAVDRETFLADASPLFFMSIAADSQADYLKDGQIKLTLKYGILLPAPVEEPLNTTYIEGMVT
jgi:hypothetical protein